MRVLPSPLPRILYIPTANRGRLSYVRNMKIRGGGRGAKLNLGGGDYVLS